MRIKIVSDGTLTGTGIVNADTGERIENVKAVAWKAMLGKDSLVSEAFVQFHSVPVEVSTTMKDKEVLRWA